uniref:RBR-type E3 ubiquitin transferase n=1 Tax=Mesocestoides corti TaxID=53468 RepID=A0A5K3ENI0_MESCO
MTDIIQELLKKPDCGSGEMELNRNRAVILSEMASLETKYGDCFKLESNEDLLGEYEARYMQRYTISVIGPPLRRNLRYSDICPFENNGDDVTYILTMLPPISLKFQLNSRYPKDPNFAFWLECAWIPSDMLDLLNMSISSLMASGGTGSSLEKCCDYLQAEAIPFLFSSGDPNILVLNVFQLFDEPRDRARLVDILIDFEEQMRDREFEFSKHDCPVCFDTFDGTNCIKLRDCGHVFCHDCAAGSFRANIEDGANSGSPICPSCAKPVRPQEIKQVVNADVYEQYETRLLNRTLSSMKDIVECPREGCGNCHVMLEADYSQGLCPQCRFHFCARCRLEFHEDTACTTGPIANLSPAEANEIVQRYKSAGPQGRAQMELEYGLININKLIDEQASYTFIGSNCKPCPNCKSPIQKISGCNRMLCSTCHKNFCWKCLVVITSANPYDHFNSSKCALYQ